VWWRAWAPSQKKNCPQNFVWVDFDAVFNRQKTRTVTRSLGTRILRFDRETKLTKQCKKYAKIRRQTKGGSRTIARPLNTPLHWFKHGFIASDLF